MEKYSASKLRTLHHWSSPLSSRRRCVRVALVVTLLIVLVLFALLPPKHRESASLMNAAAAVPPLPPRARIHIYEPISSMQSLSDVLAHRADVRNALESIYVIRTETALLSVPPTFREKAAAMFSAYGGTHEELMRALEEQRVVEVWNRITGENALFNSIRKFRPGGGSSGGDAAEQEAVAKSYTEGSGVATCDFCSMNHTAEDVFGRIVGKHSFTAANIAKLSRWHSLIITDVHDPLAYNEDVIADIIDVSHKWFKRAHHEDSLHTYPNIICDIGKRASASQVHLHLQVALTRDHYFSGIDQLQRAAARFSKLKYYSYWDEVVRLHDMIGLSVRVGDNVVLSNVCPRKEKELLVISRDPEDPSFARAVAVALMALRDAAGVRSMSFAVSYPPLNASGNYNKGEMPAIFRVIDRGSALDPRGDTGALEYFGSTYVAADPYAIIPHLVLTKKRLFKQTKL
ncbi:hypothetical protein DQ04_00571250 [Trypanosoma grayi]|uniref:hypothetical protein n=1 Tax=Trypanosoma grayi TaxID=71804 RepID=UPI0004F3F919|nr:hypothetical protein DQ04_00571250 [Trypanosoma grayi]KEG14230.1 hypothetical protein DQ04_00571250 [Trypanosoma grayi]